MKIIKWIMAILTLVTTAIMLFVFPDTIPVHFDINGIADRWGSKYEMLVLPIIMLLSVAMFEGITKFYRKKADESDNEKQKAEISSNVKVLNITTWIILLVFFVMNIFFLYASYSQVYPEKYLPEFDVMRAVTITMGITFVVMGNYMTKTRRNSTIGFRFPWTLYNDTTWNKSNRFASYVMMIAGVIIIISAIFVKGIVSTIIMLASLLISIPIMMIYAYIVYRDERKKDDEGTDKE